MTGRKDRRLESYTASSLYEIMPNDLNARGTLFGGVLSSEADKFAAYIAREYSQSNDVYTVAMYIPFYKPAYKGEYLAMKGKLVYVGDTSLGVLVEVVAKDNETVKGRRITECFILYVAKDEDGKTIRMPRPKLTERGRRLQKFGEKLKNKALELKELLYEE